LEDVYAGMSVPDVTSVSEWPHRIGPYLALDQQFAVWTDDAVLAGLLDSLLSPMAVDGSAPTDRPLSVFCAAPPRPPRTGYVIRDRVVVGTADRPSRVLRLLQWAINRQVIDSACDARLVLHAGAVVLGDRAVVMPAAMEAGKTTLTVGLLDRGCAYLSDEAVAVTDDLIVEGYAKPLSVDPGSWEVLAHHQPSASAGVNQYLEEQWLLAPQRLATVRRRGRLGALILPRYEAGARTSIERLTPASLVSAVSLCIFTRRGEVVPVERIRKLARIAEQVPGYRLLSGSLEEACSAVAEVAGAVDSPWAPDA
jgi:hypothetical protein